MEIGFDLVGITTADPVDISHQQYYEHWLSQGNAAGMGYLYRNIEKRFAPKKLLANAKSVICVAVSYASNLTSPQTNDCRIASFALYEDYHLTLKEKLFALAGFLQTQNLKPFDLKVCVDSVPLAERALACRAGLGFIGKSRMLIHPKLGNHLLLGELVTTLELEPDKPIEVSGCQGCRQCIEACPTKALMEDDFDARKCISYLTIENKDVMPRECTEKGDSYIFGCDECLKACPYSRVGAKTSNPMLKPHPEWLALTRKYILDMTEPQFQSLFANSGLIRLGLERLKRNCLSGIITEVRPRQI